MHWVFSSLCVQSQYRFQINYLVWFQIWLPNQKKTTGEEKQRAKSQLRLNSEASWNHYFHPKVVEWNRKRMFCIRIRSVFYYCYHRCANLDASDKFNVIAMFFFKCSIMSILHVYFHSFLLSLSSLKKKLSFSGVLDIWMVCQPQHEMARPTSDGDDIE